MNDVTRTNTETGTETDVIVVGGGGAGLAAAIEAGRAGAGVVLLEKNPALGGTTIRSVGSITAAGTALQARAGIRDTTEAHFDDLALFNKATVADANIRDNTGLRRVLVENAPDAIRFLADMGVVFFGPMSEPPHRVPRMHNALPHSRAFIRTMRRHARKAGVDIRVNTAATELILDGSRVRGLQATTGGETHEFVARRGVVLAAGDFGASVEMKTRYVAADIAGIPAINPTSTGDGQRLGEQAGGVIVNGDLLAIEVRFVAPPRKPLVDMLPASKIFARLVRSAMRHLPDRLLRPFLMMFVTTHLAPSQGLFKQGAILVNKQGMRFCDERGVIKLAIAEQPGNEAWIVFDQNIATGLEAWPGFISTAPGVAYAYLADYRRNRADIFYTAKTPEALAELIGVPPDALGDALDEAIRLRRPPYYALGPAKSWVAFTEGGLRVSTQLEVLDEDGEPIPGLFAAGSCGQGGVLLEGHGHHLGWAFVSGRIAGASAAAAGS
jgi:fumarate reductase flavoprotein subunit